MITNKDSELTDKTTHLVDSEAESCVNRHQKMTILRWMDVATFEATEAAASVVFTTLASVIENNYFGHLNFKYESHVSRLYCRNS